MEDFRDQYLVSAHRGNKGTAIKLQDYMSHEYSLKGHWEEHYSHLKHSEIVAAYSCHL